MTISSDVQQPFVGDYVELYTIDTRRLGGPILYFTPNILDSNDLTSRVTWQGHAYTPIDMQVEGFEWNGRGSLPQPTVRFANASTLLATLVLSFGDLIGMPFTRTRTLGAYLDGMPAADPAAHFGVENFVIEQKTAQTKQMIEFKLSAAMDQEGVELPRRQMLRKCTRRYRRFVVGITFDYTHATCPYKGTNYFDKNDVPTTPNNDACSKNVTGCRLRFAPGALPTWAFPGLARLKL